MNIHDHPEIMVAIARSLSGGFKPLLVGKMLFVPNRNYPAFLDEVCEVSGTDTELWFQCEQFPGYLILEHPQEVSQ